MYGKIVKPALAATFALLFSGLVVSFKFDDDSDLDTYITRPELRPPLFNVTVYKPESVTPGYWFTAPYSRLYHEVSSERYETCQVGPHIYDQDGNLIWSGACLLGNRPTCDFRVTTFNGGPSLSMVLSPDLQNENEDPEGVGWIMDHTFELSKTVHMHEAIPTFNMHEFNIIDDGRAALVVTKDIKLWQAPSLGNSHQEYQYWVSNNGFQEIDISSRKVLFSWDGMSHIPLSHGLVAPNSSLPKSMNHPWDYLHLNSVDKNVHGDYLISGRHTSAIYKVSRDDGHIIWQLGGMNSSFEQIGFNFSFQHDARFRYEDDSTTIISFLNNAADQTTSMAEQSSALIVELDTKLMTATAISELGRPDQDLTELRGNVQILDSGNVFVGWSSNSYISEFTPEGELAFEARFLSDRFATYRSYKFNFTGLPAEPPVLVAYAYGTTSSVEVASTVSYVSWNGATEVVSWNFYAKANGSSSEEFTFIGRTSRTGFETMFTVDGYMRYVRAEGIAGDGRSLGNSSVEKTILPSNWISSSPIPDDDFDHDLFLDSVKAIEELAHGGDMPFQVRIPLSVFLAFFCICVVSIVAGMIYALRGRIPWPDTGNYQRVDDGGPQNKNEGGFLGSGKVQGERDAVDDGDGDGGYGGALDVESLRVKKIDGL